MSTARCWVYMRGQTCDFSLFTFKGLMLQDLVSLKLISDYTVIEIPDSINDLQGTKKVKFHHL